MTATATIMEAPATAGVSDPEVLTVAEMDAIARDFAASKTPPRRRRSAQPPAAAGVCRCDRPWIFERAHCTRCGRQIGGAA